MKAKQRTVLRDIEHKVSREIVEFAAGRQAGTIVIGDIRDIADGIACGTEHNVRMSRLDHGKIRTYVASKAAAEGIAVELVDEHHTTKTCPHPPQTEGAHLSLPVLRVSGASRRGRTSQHPFAISRGRRRQTAGADRDQVSYPARRAGST